MQTEMFISIEWVSSTHLRSSGDCSYNFISTIPCEVDWDTAEEILAEIVKQVWGWHTAPDSVHRGRNITVRHATLESTSQTADTYSFSVSFTADAKFKRRVKVRAVFIDGYWETEIVYEE
jgi:hypothetical protein